MPEATTSLAVAPPGKAELSHHPDRTGGTDLPSCPGGSGRSSVFPGASRGATQFLNQPFSLCTRRRYLWSGQLQPPHHSPAQPCALSHTTVLRECSTASSGSSPSSDLPTIDIALFSTSLTVRLKACTAPAKQVCTARSRASLSEARSVPLQWHLQLRLRLHGESGFTSKPKESGCASSSQDSVADPVLLAADQRFSCTCWQRCF